jgi:sigma-B regulation protein RsbU (phosphoserine phosphatase)
MTILIAEDDPVTRKILESILIKWGYDVIVTCDGSEAWQVLQSENAPKLVILDWIMPGIDGLELCRKIRSKPNAQPVYIILLTAKGQKEDIIKGLRNGADDYVTKPFNRDELGARVQTGLRIVELQASLAVRIKELENALSNIKQLQGLLPICCYCKKIRDDHNYWQQVDEYVTQHSEVKFSHSICPECYEKIVKPELEKMVSNS